MKLLACLGAGLDRAGIALAFLPRRRLSAPAAAGGSARRRAGLGGSGADHA